MRGSSSRRQGRLQRSLAVLAAATLLATGVALGQCIQPPAGMVAWWPGDGTTADLAGSNTGTWNGAAAYTAGEVGLAFSFGGASWVQAPSTAALSPTAALTIDAWIAPQATTSSRIVDKITAGGQDGYLLDVLNNSLRLIIGGQALQGATTLQPGVTYHVAGTFDGATLTVYVNGAVDGSAGAIGTLPANALPLRIGADQTGANTFNGWIDEVEVFNRALSPQEILAIHNAFAAGKCKQRSIPATSGLSLLVLVLLIAAATILLRREPTRG
jgi:hypothetical protein